MSRTCRRSATTGDGLAPRVRPQSMGYINGRKWPNPRALSELEKVEGGSAQTGEVSSEC